MPISNLQETRNKVKTGAHHESENQALTASIDDLENEVKSNLASGAGATTSQKKRQYMLASKQPVKPKNEPDEQYLTAPSQPDTVMEEPDLEVSDQDDDLLIEESDDVLDSNLNKAEARLKQLENEESKGAELGAGLPAISSGEPEPNRFGSVSLLGASILESETPEDYNWQFEDVADLN